MQVSHVALQTDSCDTLYITKNALTAYTIAIVQNTQALQYDQMHVALQMARNQASLETPLRADELMTAHFNLVVLSKETDINKTSDAQKPEATNHDTEPSASAADEETYVKIPSRRYAANCDAKKQHPTGAVAPTCRREYCTVSLSLFADLERILRRLYVFTEEPCKSTTTTSEPCSPVFKEVQPRPSEHSKLEYHTNNLNLYMHVFGLLIIYCCNKKHPTGL